MRNAIMMSLIVCCAAGCSQPMGPIAGGELDGEAGEWPDDWSFTTDIENFLLETNPDDPYSVTVWGVTHENDFYIAAGSNENRWVRHLASNADVRLSVEGIIYSGRAVRITDEREISSVLKAYPDKYEYEEYEGDFVENGVLYRIESR